MSHYKFQLLQVYLKFEKSSGDPARVQVLYERAVTEFPVSTDLWLDYTKYMDKTLKVFPYCSPLFSFYCPNNSILVLNTFSPSGR